MNRVKRVSFVVRLVQDRRGEISGVIERVATGAKERFSGVGAIGEVMRRMLPGDPTLIQDGAGARLPVVDKPVLGRRARRGSGQAGATD